MLYSAIQSIELQPRGVHGLTVLDDKIIEWLLIICPEM